MSDLTQNIALEIATRIRSANSDNTEDPLPTTDTIYKYLCGDIVDSKEQLYEYLNILNQSHYIFILKIVDEDLDKKVIGINGYLAAEKDVIEKLQGFAALQLEQLYAGQFYERKHAGVIKREMMSKVKTFNNTPIGKSLNTAIMLDQFVHLLTADAAEYDGSWQQKQLNELIQEKTVKPNEIEEDDTLEAEKGLRAVDSDEYQRLQQANLSGKWGVAVSRYGVQFLVRVHLRKYEFDTVMRLVKSKKVALESDLVYLRDTLRKMEGNISIDPRLGPHMEKIIELRRLVQSRINRLFTARKESEY